ncbi:MAG: PilT/PilU family type 4a pilus ATPase [Porticoccaceae bacterium]
MTLNELLSEVVVRGGSDLFLSVGAPPMIKVEGVVSPCGDSKLTEEHVDAMIRTITDEQQQARFADSHELNMPLSLGAVGRFRINLFRQRGYPAMVARFIKSSVPAVAELGLPALLNTLILEDRGLVLLVGGTGTGKSTTLAAMINYRARLKTGHILTIEDPIEYLFEHQQSLVNQREIGVDTDSYAIALKNAMREAPDVIMIGEVRDMETMKQAISYAETGHLCLTTLHASNAAHALDRIKNLFPDTAQKQLRSDLSSHLRAIVSQRLAIGKDGKRVAVVEVMLTTPLIQELIYQDRGAEIQDAMIQARALGCQTFEDHLFELVQQDRISPQEALHHADSKTNLTLRFRLEGTGAQKRPQVPLNVRYCAKTAFRDIATYKIKPVKLVAEDSSRNNLIEKGIRLAMKAKGLHENEARPDVEIRYLVCDGRSDLLIGGVEFAVKAHTATMTDSDIDGALEVSIIDMTTTKPVWVAVASSKLLRELRDDDSLSGNFLELFSEFPPLQL